MHVPRICSMVTIYRVLPNKQAAKTIPRITIPQSWLGRRRKQLPSQGPAFFGGAGR